MSAPVTRPAINVQLLRTMRQWRKIERCHHASCHSRVGENGWKVYDCPDCGARGMEFNPNCILRSSTPAPRTSKAQRILEHERFMEAVFRLGKPHLSLP